MADKDDYDGADWSNLPEDDGRAEPGYASLILLMLLLPLLGIYAIGLGMFGRSLFQLPMIILRDAFSLQPLALIIVALLAGLWMTFTSWVREWLAQKRK